MAHFCRDNVTFLTKAPIETACPHCISLYFVLLTPALLPTSMHRLFDIRIIFLLSFVVTTRRLRASRLWSGLMFVVNPPFVKLFQYYSAADSLL